MKYMHGMDECLPCQKSKNILKLCHGITARLMVLVSIRNWTNI